VKEKPDIIVVGGGPCGSYAAYTAAKLGAEVLVCEEHEEIGAPRHCSGHLSVSSLRRLGLRVPQGAVENEIRGAVFWSPSGKEFVLRCRAPVTYVVNRELFDKSLAELAIKAGVQYRFKSRAKSLIFESGCVRGVSLKGEERVEANVVVDAEGCSSKLLKNTGLHGLRGSMMVKGIQAEVDRVEDVNDDMVEVYFGRNVAPSFFAWIIPRNDGSAKVGLATKVSAEVHGETSCSFQETEKKQNHIHFYPSHTLGWSTPQNVFRWFSCSGRCGFPSETHNRRRRHLWDNMR